MAAAKHIELPAVVVPPHLWLRSARPTPGKILQAVLPGIFIVAGLLASRTALRVSLVAAGIGVYLLLPVLIMGRLERIGREILAADRKTAADLLRTLRTRPIVQFFAPHAWLTLQEGILSLKLGDGRVAAANFVETARLVRQPDAVMLISAQAHALVLAGERVEARELLQRLARENLISPRDQLDLGVVLLIDTKKHKQAQSYIETARKTIGDHPRVLAALGLALQKAERIDEASELLEQVQVMHAAKGVDLDPIADDLAKRLSKAMQGHIEAQLRKERRNRSRRTTIVVSSDLAASEIVSGEIGAGDQANLDNPTTGFKPAEPAPTIITAKTVDEQLTVAERKMLNIPDTRARREPTSNRPEPSRKRDQSLSGPNISIDEDSAAHATPEKAESKPTATKARKTEPGLVIEEMPPARMAPIGEPPSGQLLESLGSLFDEPETPVVPPPNASPTGLINTALAVPVVSAGMTTASLPPPEALPPPPEKPEADVPVFRRRQTLTAIPVASDKSSSVPAFPVGGGTSSGLPTRKTLHEGNASTIGAPRTTTPVFKAPNLKTGDDDKR